MASGGKSCGFWILKRLRRYQTVACAVGFVSSVRVDRVSRFEDGLEAGRQSPGHFHYSK